LVKLRQNFRVYDAENEIHRQAAGLDAKSHKDDPRDYQKEVKNKVVGFFHKNGKLKFIQTYKIFIDKQ
jgi:hypothetical protein